MNRSRILLLFILVATASLAAAKPPFLKVFMAYYKLNPDSKIGKARCLNCHQPPGPPNRNPYGKAVQAALRAANARMVTPDILKSVETKNMGEGLTFLAKIKHDMPPGQPKPKAGSLKGKSKKGYAEIFPRGSSNVLALLMICAAPVGLLIRKR